MTSAAYLGAFQRREPDCGRAVIRVLLVGAREFCARISTALAEIVYIQVVRGVDGEVDPRSAIVREQPDLVVADVRVQRGSEYDVAPLPRDYEVIFIAQDSGFAAEAFSCRALDYLIEPIDAERLGATIQRLRDRNAVAPRSVQRGSLSLSELHLGIWVKSLGRAVFVPVNSITRVEAQGEYVMLHTAQRSYLARMQMQELEARIAPYDLVRVHRSHAVQLAQISEYRCTGNRIIEVILRCGTSVKVSARYAALLKRLIARTEVNLAASSIAKTVQSTGRSAGGRRSRRCALDGMGWACPGRR